MRVRYSCVAGIIAVLVGASATSRAQGIDLSSQPLEGIDDLPEEEEAPSEPGAMPAAAAARPSEPGAMPMAVEKPTSSARTRPPGQRDYDVKLDGDFDDDGRYGTYLDALFKRNVLGTEGFLVLVPEVTARGDNLSNAAMGTRGLKLDGSLRAAWTPQHVPGKRLQLAVVAGGSYMTTEAADTRSLTVGTRVAVAFCPLQLCRDLKSDGEQLRAGASFSDPSTGSNSYKLDLAYALKRKYDSVPAPRMLGKTLPKRIAATLFASWRNTDAGWATTLGGELSVDATIHVQIGVQLQRTLEGGAASAGMTQAGLYLSLHPTT